MPRPVLHDPPPFYAAYINLTKGNTPEELIHNHSKNIENFFSAIPDAKGDDAYAPGKWTVKEMIQHLIDAERVFCYRILCISRGEKTSLPGFDENFYAEHSNANTRTLQSLKEEFSVVRKSTDLLLASLSEDQLARSGTANNNPIDVNTVCFKLYGHILHHKNILIERYKL